MNPIVIALIVAPVLWLTYQAGRTAGRKQINRHAIRLSNELFEMHDNYQDAVDDATNLRYALVEASRRLSDCTCGHRLTPAEEATYFELVDHMREEEPETW